MILRSPLSIPPNPLAGPRRIGDQTDYIELDPANGQIDTAGAASPLTVNNLLLDLWRPPASGKFTTGIFSAKHASGAPFTEDQIYAVPCVLPREGTYTDLRVYISNGQAGAKARLGIYEDDSGVPGALIEDTGEITPTASGFYEASFAGSRTLGPGFYWLAYIVDTAIVIIRRIDTTAALSLGIDPTVTNQGHYYCVYRSFSYAALPDPFGSITAYAMSYPPCIELKGA